MPRAWKHHHGGRASALLLLLLLVLPSLVPLPTTAEELVATSAHLPEGLIDAATAWDGHRAYLVGGRNATALQDHVWAYDPATGSVTVLPGHLSHPMQSLTAVEGPDGPLVFGGARVVAEATATGGLQAVIKPSDRVLALDPSTGNLRTLPDRLPQGAFAMASAWTGQAAYLFGGINTTRLPDGSPHYVTLSRILRYDPTAPAGSRVTTLGTHLPLPMRDLSAAWSGRYIYLFGGIAQQSTPNGSRVIASDRILRFDPADGNLTVLNATLPTPMRWAGVTVADHRVYLLGGCRGGCGDPANDTLATVLRFNLTTERVQQVNLTLPTPLVSPMAFYDGSYVELVGGRGPRSIDDARATIERLAPGATPPGPPGDLALARDGDAVALTWTPPADDGGAPIQSYRVERATGSGAFQTVLTVPGNAASARDAGAPAGTPLRYRVLAVGPGGPGVPTAPGTISLPAHAPAPPADLEALGYDGGIVVRWNPPADDGGAPVTGYRVVPSDGPAVTVAGTSYYDEGVPWGTNVTYRVEARNDAGTSAAAGPVTARPTHRLAPPRNLTLVPGNGSITLQWDPPAGSVQGYVVLRGDDPNHLGTSVPVSSTGYVDDGLAAGSVFWYQVEAVNASGGDGVPTRALRGAILAPPGAVTDLRVTLEGRNATLRWSAPSDLGGAQTVYYLVTRQAAGDATPQAIQPDFYTATSFVDRNLPANATYRYRVEAVNAAGHGPEAGPASVTVPAPDRPPVAVASLSDAQANTSQRVTVDARGSRDPDGSVAALQVDWGDGTLTPWQGSLTASHAYARAGNFTVTVTVQDDHGRASDPAPPLHVQVSKAPSPRDNPTGTGTVEPGNGGAAAGGGNGVPGPGPVLLVALLALAALVTTRRRIR